MMLARRILERISTACLASLLLLLPAGEAFGFCRTTTCTCTAKQQTNGTSNPCEAECPSDEHGCKTTGNPVAWTGRCIGYSIDIAGTASLSADQLDDVLTKAFATWGGADCGNGQHPSIDTRSLRGITCGRNEYDPNGPNANAVYFEDNGWDGRDIDHLLALTMVHFDPHTGELMDADMAINSAAHDFSVSDENVKNDLLSVVTHEVGHFLGLDHSDDENAVMYFQYSEGNIRRELSPDDIAGICTAYPPDREASCNPTPHGGLKATCTNGKAGCSVGSEGVPGGDPGTLVSIAVGALGVVGRRITIRRRRR